MVRKEWYYSDRKANALLLAADVGGTNTNVALVEYDGREYSIMAHWEFASQKISGLEEALEEIFEDINSKLGEAKVEAFCASGAGPVEDNVCILTNLPWKIDGNEIERDTGIPTVVINDFSAVCYGVPILERQSPSSLVPIPHVDGSIPERRGSIRAVIGAGTGLGVGFLVDDRGQYHAYPSEGGHIDFPASDDLMEEIRKYLSFKYKHTPGTEAVLSGQGIANIFSFMLDSGNIGHDDLIREILSVPDTDKPPLIAKYSENHAGCRRVMEFFISVYGHMAGNYALCFLPTAGLYLAGGIVAKNIDYFQKSPVFMRYFESSYRKNMTELLKKIPVYIIKDYSISVYGAAYAAQTFARRGDA
ncbi:glucokinase [Spirochaetia bacterium 38H-sp]|uniref:Glucokinase n=1 Tax=Rarispira pelagica TaxID=3141764 RepID=A0ABU9UCW2_9SPIR